MENAIMSLFRRKRTSTAAFGYQGRISSDGQTTTQQSEQFLNGNRECTLSTMLLSGMFLMRQKRCGLWSFCSFWFPVKTLNQLLNRFSKKKEGCWSVKLQPTFCSSIFSDLPRPSFWFLAISADSRIQPA